MMLRLTKIRRRLMKRSILACIAGLCTWFIVVNVIDHILRVTLSDYTAAEKTLLFTLAMKWARIFMAIATGIAAGAVTGWISPSSRWPPWVVGGVTFAIFLPAHVSIWSKFPVWYHLTFLLTIVPAVLVGAMLAPRRNKPRQLARTDRGIS
jgi:hypothetical protein